MTPESYIKRKKDKRINSILQYTLGGQMIQKIDLSGIWSFQLDKEKLGFDLEYHKGGFGDSIHLPGTTAEAKKGEKNPARETGYLTEEYAFSGYAWFEKEFYLDSKVSNLPLELYLERTRISHVWLDGNYIGTRNSLCTSHKYNLGMDLEPGKHTLVIMIDNTNYPTKGGHMTSPDTQTNWNGITGAIELRSYSLIHVTDVSIYPSIEKQGVTLFINYANQSNTSSNVTFKITNKLLNATTSFDNEQVYDIIANPRESSATLFYSIQNPKLWDEFNPNIYQLNILIDNEDKKDTWSDTFGFRSFVAVKEKFIINNHETFLRGKHDGMIFPITGYAPTTVEGWLTVMKKAKEFGINHYRFHTCCPPDAAFQAADILGIYMEPELPFWGTVTDETYPEHKKDEQEYLILEGKRILKEFGNHPSFVMMSLGNELWGSKERISEILRVYKDLDNRHLYTQGSNNFQFVPDILKEEDFFVGVRFDKNRLFRGSYAMCDAPLGHVQTTEPGTLFDYDDNIMPGANVTVNGSNEEETITIQYHDHTKEVKASSQTDCLVPSVPVISHEIGQYETYPNYKEIDKYTGVLKARNFEIFKQRLEDRGLGDLADAYFKASGQLAVACYKEELEAALRTKYLSGFHLLDLQDFSGQGTALVGVLDAFMEEKGTITSKEWRRFCSDAVLLGRFKRYNYESGDTLDVTVQIRYHKQQPLNLAKLKWSLEQIDTQYTVIQSGTIDLPTITNGLSTLADIKVTFPEALLPMEYRLRLMIEDTDIENEYKYSVYPKRSLSFEQHEKYDVYKSTKTGKNVYIVHNYDEITEDFLQKGENVLLLPNTIKNGLQGFYCTDFWCYPMFRSISESMNREVPVGTMGLLIDNKHKSLNDFQTEYYATPKWYQIVSNSTATILNDTSSEYRPIVQVIDNFERNHKLGILFEAKVMKNQEILNGNLLVCTSKLEEILEYIEVNQFFYSILEYASSDEFLPEQTLNTEFIKNM